MRFAFRFRWIPFLAMLLVAGIGLALGEWQRGRANQKDDLAATLSQRAALEPLVLRGGDKLPVLAQVEFRRVLAYGEFIAGWPVYLDNRPHGGAPGFYLLMPFRLGESGPTVLVLRGWLPRDPRDRSRLPPLVTPRGPVTIEGTLRRHPGHVLQLGEPAAIKPGAIVQNLSPADFTAASAMPVLNLIIEQSPGANGGNAVNDPSRDGLVRDWPQPSSGADKHRGYAFQWYALAATAFLFFLVTGFRRGSK
ncbi:SURF1 family protein [Lacisediminimonas sp.]|uniref:SURF1 family protein n=1 Tax=Lacisediminimonas sp. TaxID=3060582 RepID=UPI0027233E03|nr:SURF1 family protein [Lacisediminimonas sp.]MDO8298627.1 SURF1 family protein [Lacisediminimonas sp.]